MTTTFVFQSYKIFSTYAEMLATHLDEPWTQDVQLRFTKIFRSVLWNRVMVVILGLWLTQKNWIL